MGLSGQFVLHHMVHHLMVPIFDVLVEGMLNRIQNELGLDFGSVWEGSLRNRLSLAKVYVDQ